MTLETTDRTKISFSRTEDSSLISLSIPVRDYSASAIARAVEDSDSHLLAMATSPSEDGMLETIIKVGRKDPAGAVRSLRRYGFNVTYADESPIFEQLSKERLDQLRIYLNTGKSSDQ